jgi:hypothetical protein
MIIVETVIATLLSVLIAFLGYKVYSLKAANKDIVLSLLQETLDKAALAEKVKETQDMINNTNIDDKDGFIKFLSQSREWAFEYIENVQAAIIKLDVGMKAQDQAQILEAYNELLKFMPEEEKIN